MMTQIPLTQARNKLTNLPERSEKNHEAVAVTRRGKPVMAIMDWELYESIIETMAVLSDDRLLAAIKKSAGEFQAGNFKTLEQVKKELLA